MPMAQSGSSTSTAICILVVALLACLVPSSAQSCSKALTFKSTQKLFASCLNLDVQGASLAWTLEPENGTLDVLFSGIAPSSSGWVAWGINPGPSPAMLGTQAFIAFQASNGSTILPYNITSKAASPVCSPISLEVLDSQVQISGTSITMFVSLKLQKNQIVLNHVWNRGSTVSKFQPGVHSFVPADLLGLKAINMSSGIVTASTSKVPHQKLKNIHGLLNAIGWGILLPLGVIVSRFLRPFSDSTRFYIHVSNQIIAYCLCLSGFTTGLILGKDSVGVVYHKHRSVGIAVFTILSLQVFSALMVRPKKSHEIRPVWNFCHYAVGLSIIILGIVNIFYGFDILAPAPIWRHAYIGIIVSLVSLALIREIVSWICSCQRQKSPPEKLHGATVGGANGISNGRSYV